MILIIDVDFLYHIAPRFTVSFHEKFKKRVSLNFQKLAGPWLVGEVDIHVAIYGSTVAEGFSVFQRRSCSYYHQDKDISRSNTTMN